MLKPVFKSKKVIISTIIILFLLASIITGIVASSTGTRTRVKQKLELGEKYLSEMKYEEAILVFKEVIEIEPRNVQAYLGISEAYVALEQPEEAITWLETGISEIEAHGEVIEGCEELYIKESEIHQRMDNDDLAKDVLEAGYTFTLLEIFIKLLEELTGFNAEQITHEINISKDDNDVKDDSSSSAEEIITNSIIELEQDKKIEWIDYNLEEAIRELIQKETSDVYLSDIWYLDSIELPNKNIETLEDISFFEGLPNLRFLDLSSNEISDISALKNLTNLQDLFLFGNEISDISSLKNLANLEVLVLDDNKISDISSLKNLANLEGLTLSNNRISDISSLKNLANLEVLVLSNNRISDISSLKNLTNLHSLELDINEISDISALMNLTNLQYLYLYDNKISDISSLKNLTNLQQLTLSNNRISDISSLKNLTNLTYLGLGENKISDISSLKNLTNLTVLDLSNNKISDISALKNLANLEELNLHDLEGLINDWSSVEHVDDVWGRPE